MSPTLQRFLAVQAIRYFASLQAFVMVVMHGGWILLAIASWSHASGSTGDVAAIGRGLMRAYAWLGGVDADGHGDGGNLFAVWGKVSIVVYLLDCAWRAVRGVRPATKLWRVALGSGLVALIGYAVGMWPASSHDPGGIALVAGIFAVVTTGATAWAVGARRLAEWLIARMDRSNAQSVANPAGVA